MWRGATPAVQLAHQVDKDATAGTEALARWRLLTAKPSAITESWAIDRPVPIVPKFGEELTEIRVDLQRPLLEQNLDLGQHLSL